MGGEGGGGLPPEIFLKFIKRFSSISVTVFDVFFCQLHIFISIFFKNTPKNTSCLMHLTKSKSRIKGQIGWEETWIWLPQQKHSHHKNIWYSFSLGKKYDFFLQKGFAHFPVWAKNHLFSFFFPISFLPPFSFPFLTLLSFFLLFLSLFPTLLLFFT